MKTCLIDNCDKPSICKGLCNNCYHKIKRNENRKILGKESKCHPNRASFCDGLCYNCYRKENKSKGRKRKMSLCHPDKPESAKGLCTTCYQKIRGIDGTYSPEYKKRYRERQKTDLRFFIRSRLDHFRQRDKETDLTVDYLMDLLNQQDRKCYYTGFEMEIGSIKLKKNTLSLDRLIPERRI